MKQFLYVFSAFACLLAVTANAKDRSFVENANATNQALLVGSSHGLPGIDLDVKSVEELAKHSSYQFSVSKLEESEAIVTNVKQELTKVSRDSGEDGTMFFYFTGHGNYGVILLNDTTIHINDIRKAIEAGREGQGKLKRLVMMYDSCHAGSLLDPVRSLIPMYQTRDPKIQSALFADEIVRGMGDTNARGETSSNYWEKLFVFASSTADENSLAGENGSVFTVAMKKAFVEVAQAGGTMDSFVKKSQEYTVGHHPVARMVPVELGAEKLTP